MGKKSYERYEFVKTISIRQRCEENDEILGGVRGLTIQGLEVRTSGLPDGAKVMVVQGGDTKSKKT